MDSKISSNKFKDDQNEHITDGIAVQKTLHSTSHAPVSKRLNCEITTLTLKENGKLGTLY